ncbi:MAG: hypothetical protein EPO24_11450 [Bacteroidetes bacterium]|nr:MAG: hypothetical protein EPO24_11450 [Bacteroidota bacterium]
MKRKSFYINSFLAAILMVTFWGCSTEDTPLPNQPPIARLANVPPSDRIVSLTNPRLKLYWVGDDPDGFITAFKYRWSYTITSGNVTDTLQKAWFTVLNIMYGSGQSALTLMLDTSYQNSEIYTTKVYKYIANLPPETGLPDDIENGLIRGDTVSIEGVRVYASNPDSIIDQSSGLRVEKRYPVHDNPNSGTFIFDSQDSINFHSFQLIAIDNFGALSDTATVQFITTRVPPPTTTILTYPQEEGYVLDRYTDSFTGLRFTFQGNDANSRTLEYQWVVDKELYDPEDIPWSQWSERPYAFVTARDFKDPYAYEHKFYVRARNEFGSIDTLGYYVAVQRDDNGNVTSYDTIRANVTFHTVYPEFAKPGYQKRTLLLNNSFEYYDTDTNVGPAHPTFATLNAYWQEIMDEAGMSGKYDFRITTKDSFPTLLQLGAYSSIVLFADVTDQVGRWFRNPDHDTSTSLVGSKGTRLTSYCYIGGRIIWSAKNLALNLNTDADLRTRVLHIQGTQQDLLGGFIGAKGYEGYPDVSVDTAKLDTAWHGGLREVWYVLPVGFGERVYTINHRDNDLFPFLNLNSNYVGIRYEGITFSSIYLGYPLYYIKKSEAVLALKKALEDIEAY